MSRYDALYQPTTPSSAKEPENDRVNIEIERQCQRCQAKGETRVDEPTPLTRGHTELEVGDS